MAAPALVPVVIAATGAIRMVGAPIARALASRGIVSKATAKQVKNFGKNIPKMSRQMQGKLTKEGARNVPRRTPMRGPGGRKLSQLEKQKLMRENISKGKNSPTSSTAKSRIDKVSNAANVVDKGARVKDAVNKSTRKAAKKQKDEKALQAKEQATQRSTTTASKTVDKPPTATGSINKPLASRPRPRPTVGSRKVPPRGTSGRPSATPANASGLRSLAS